MPKLNLLIRVVISFLLIYLPLQGLDQWIYDRFFQVRGQQKKPTPIVLIRVNPHMSSPVMDPNITDPSARDLLKNPLVWHDSFYAPLLRRLQAGKPRLIVFASFYDRARRSRDWSDENLIFSAILNEEGKLIPPPPALTQDTNYGFCNLFPDPDNVVRRTYLEYSSGESLALRIYHRLRGTPAQALPPEPLLVDYRGTAGSYPGMTAEEVMRAETLPIDIEDKIVLVGREGTDVAEFETPIGRMSRLEIQANAIDTFLTQRGITPMPRWATQAMAAVAVLASILILLNFPLTMAWVLLIFLALGLLLLALLLFSQFKIWLGIASPLFCIFGTHLIILGYTLSRQEEQQWRLKQQTDSLKEMDEFKNNFLSLFSHDLKTPIAKIRAVTKRLLTEYPTLAPPVIESLHSIDRTNDELARLISDILRVTKMESMSIEPEKQVVDLNRLVENAIASLRFQADQKEIELVLDLEPLFSIEGDAQLIQEVITNLLENAIKYSPRGSKVLVRTSEEDNRVRVLVQDEGPGIPPDEVPRVTGKFYRGKREAQATKGTGLGLYLSDYFVQLHGGSLQIRSDVGKGTSVSFWLPLDS